MNNLVDIYFVEGCGRCPLGGTPQCKVNSWREEMKLLRNILLDCGLTEEVKWSVPCYTYKGKNIVVLSALKDCCTLGFFKGVLLKDALGLLDKPGDNSQSARIMKFTNCEKIIKIERSIKAYIFEAVEVEKAGLTVKFKKTEEYNVPMELQNKLDQNPDFKVAFDALTPGRQRGYLLHFSQPKQSKTREARIEKCMPMIYEGKGWNGR